MIFIKLDMILFYLECSKIMSHSNTRVIKLVC
jgi:hypothetical protein